MTRVLFSTAYFTFERDRSGDVFVRSGDGVLVVPLDETGRVLLAREYAPAMGGETLVLPGGEVEADELEVETANRELQEEIGYRAGRLDLLGKIRPWAKFVTVRYCVYLARDLTPSKLEGDETYPITVRPATLDEIDGLVAAGRLQDAPTLAALFLAREQIERR